MDFSKRIRSLALALVVLFNIPSNAAGGAEGPAPRRGSGRIHQPFSDSDEIRFPSRAGGYHTMAPSKSIDPLGRNGKPVLRLSFRLTGEDGLEGTGMIYWNIPSTNLTKGRINLDARPVTGIVSYQVNLLDHAGQRIWAGTYDVAASKPATRAKQRWLRIGLPVDLSSMTGGASIASVELWAYCEDPHRAGCITEYANFRLIGE